MLGKRPFGSTGEQPRAGGEQLGPSSKRARPDGAAAPQAQRPQPPRQQATQPKRQQQQKEPPRQQATRPQAQQQQRSSQPKPQERPQLDRRRAAGAAAGGGGGARVQPSSSRTKFFEALAAGAEDPDIRSEEELRRLLKLQKGQKTSKLDADGLDDLLAGITAAASDSEGEGAAGRGGAGGGGGGLGSESDGDPFGIGGSSESEDFESEGAEEEEEEEEEGGLDGLGSSDEGLSSEGGSGSGSDSGDDGSGGSSSGGGSESGGGFEGLSSSDGEGEESESSGEGTSDGGGRPVAAAAKAAKAGRATAVPKAGGAGAYVPPALRRQQEAAAAAAAAGGGGGGGGGLDPAVERRITGLLNRLAESNLQGVVRDVAALYSSHGRRAVAAAVAERLVGAAEEGPRASEQFAAVAAAFIAGLAATARAQDVAALFLERLAAALERAYAAGDGQGCRNLTLLLAYCYSCGLLAADCLYSFLGVLAQRFTEEDVMILAALLNAVGLQLRADDPAAMKDFVVAVHEAAARARACGAVAGAGGGSASGEAGAAAPAGGLTKRAELMLELVMDIKNNRTGTSASARRPRASAAADGAGGGGRRGGAAAALAPAQAKWLRGAGVDDVRLVNLSWAKLTAPGKKGMWWLPAAGDAAAGLLPGLSPRDLDLLPPSAAAGDGDESDGEGGGGGGGGGHGGGAGGAAELLALAAAQRMNTDVRKAAFLAIMGSDDCAEACEKLLRLPLKGEQDREVVRVLVDCALSEAPWNPYYGHLAARLAAASKSHKTTLQFAVWDQLKELEAAPVPRLDALANLTAALLARRALPLAALKVVDFDSSPRWTPKELFFWRLALRQLLAGFPSDAEAAAAFGRLSEQKQHGALCRGLSLFLKTRVGPWLVSRADAAEARARGGGGAEAGARAEADALLRRLHAAERTLARGQAALLTV
ncbi:hypothetical protein Rsub_02235 [Raphidocelis subcapitata]|uniref:MI domain-containing protein n=1 Tax=Raphidocelis subcapitata TaxID=307507 RepID=A0A2V0NWP1_9CHLO|nr:hypothetical protein Rsub_02235 [Raphidocelis subcapitata]|eukprot:GBF89357.1 hypothetical protein Rsub_02235 [Raphidocelis subcapitata]